jgi:hypothetical protein
MRVVVVAVIMHPLLVLLAVLAAVEQRLLTRLLHQELLVRQTLAAVLVGLDIYKLMVLMVVLG